MRINIYSQELITDDNQGPIIEAVEANSNTDTVYSAVRLFLHSSDKLHHPPMDDDRSAITFWLPRSPERRERLANQFELMARMVRYARTETGLD